MCSRARGGRRALVAIWPPFGRILASLLFVASISVAQDSVDVTFRYTPSGMPSVVHLAGEFNNWANNSNGVINPGSGWTMVKQQNGAWTKTVRLKIGGGTGPGGSYQYKFNENGSSSGWIADPLNSRSFGAFGNSIVSVRSPMVFQIQPVDNSVVMSDRPVILMGLFTSPAGSIDLSSSKIFLDRAQVMTAANSHALMPGIYIDTLPPTPDGFYVMSILVSDAEGNNNSDSVRFTVQGSPLHWLTRTNPHIYDSVVTVRGIMFNSTVSDIRVLPNTADTITADVTGTDFSARLSLREGPNQLRAIGLKDGLPVSTNTITLTRIVDHDPRPEITFGINANTISLNAVTSTDPDHDPLTFHWRSEDEHNPFPLAINQSGPIVFLSPPPVPGEYYFTLQADDPTQRSGRVRSYFTIGKDSSVTFPTIESNPQWVKDAIVYEVFVPSFSASGTLRGVLDKLSYITSLGVNTLWLMPIMNNRGTVNEMNGGYDIIDFFDVDESLGTLADFSALRDSCHAHGIKVILDITPNHVSAEHPWVNDIRQWQDESVYRGFVENRVLGNARDLGQSVTQQNGYPLYAHYSNWSLANLNPTGKASFHAMMDVFHFWVDSMKADGFRLDVYWGLQNRYGSAGWWRPFREAIKRSKPDMFLLGETDGTGNGSEWNYADGGGALDAGYDWNWYGQVKTTLSAGDVLNMHNRTANYSPGSLYNFYTGTDASYFRFLENHDEERIAQIFSNRIEQTLPGVVLLLTAPGIPMIYAGQEIGWQGRRDKVNFEHPPTSILLPAYRKLVRLRTAHAAFRSPKIKLVSSATAGVYSFLRPHHDGNMLVVINFNPTAADITCSLPEGDLELQDPMENGRKYFLNDLLNDSSYAITKEDLSRIRFHLEAFQSRVLQFADSASYPVLTSMAMPSLEPSAGILFGESYPQPFEQHLHHTVSIPFRLENGATGPQRYRVSIQLFDILGRKHVEMFDNRSSDGSLAYSLPSSILQELQPGMYYCRLVVIGTGEQRPLVQVRPVQVLP